MIPHGAVKVIELDVEVAASEVLAKEGVEEFNALVGQTTAAKVTAPEVLTKEGVEEFIPLTSQTATARVPGGAIDDRKLQVPKLSSFICNTTVKSFSPPGQGKDLLHKQR